MCPESQREEVKNKIKIFQRSADSIVCEFMQKSRKNNKTIRVTFKLTKINQEGRVFYAIFIQL